MTQMSKTLAYQLQSADLGSIKARLDELRNHHERTRELILADKIRTHEWSAKATECLQIAEELMRRLSE